MNDTSDVERVTRVKEMLRGWTRSLEDLCVALNGIHPEQERAQGFLTCPHGSRAEGMTATDAVTAIRSLCGQCGSHE